MEKQASSKATSYRPADRLAGVSEYYFSRKLKEVAEMNAKGLDVISLGDVYGGDECIVNEGGTFREAYHLKAGVLVGCTLIGSREHFSSARGAIGKPFAEVRGSLGL